MEISQIIPHVEALIFAADRPLPVLEILDLLNNALAFLEDRATLDQVETAIEAIREKYGSEFYAFEVRESGGGYQFLTKKDYYQTVAQLNGEKFLKRLSTAALETLAIIAYRQPISKGEIEHIRGVSTDYSIQKLLEKELIVISGRSEQLPGKPLLYATSKAFMDYFGLNSPNDLPKLKEVFDEETIQPTLVLDAEEGATAEAEAELQDEALGLEVSENGELVQHLTELPLLNGHEAGLEEAVESEGAIEEITATEEEITEAPEETPVTEADVETPEAEAAGEWGGEEEKEEEEDGEEDDELLWEDDEEEEDEEDEEDEEGEDEDDEDEDEEEDDEDEEDDDFEDEDEEEDDDFDEDEDDFDEEDEEEDLDDEDEEEDEDNEKK